MYANLQARTASTLEYYMSYSTSYLNHYTIHILFTTSYNSGKLPADWRSANITAIYKKGNKKEPKNIDPLV